MKLPHWIGYVAYCDENKNVCLKGRAFQFFYALAIMLFLGFGLPIAFVHDKTVPSTASVFFMILILPLFGIGTSINILFYRPIQRLIRFTTDGKIHVQDRMMLGHRAFELKLDDISSIVFAYYYVRGGRVFCYLIARLKDGKEQCLDEKNIVISGKTAKDAILLLKAFLSGQRREGTISVVESSLD